MDGMAKCHTCRKRRHQKGLCETLPTHAKTYDAVVCVERFSRSARCLKARRCADSTPPSTSSSGRDQMVKNRKGFTLIELLIVVVIIGILAAIAIPKFANTKSKAYITAMKSDLRNLVTAEEAFFADSAKYTGTISQLKFSSTTGVNSPTIVT